MNKKYNFKELKHLCLSSFNKRNYYAWESQKIKNYFMQKLTKNK